MPDQDTITKATNKPFLGDKEEENLSDESKSIELLSEDVQEIMGQVPHWIVRWGITVIFSVIVLLIAGSFLFKYPDVITSDITIISENPAATLVARTSGKIDNLFIKNGEKVEKGQILAVLENTANADQVFDLKEKLESFSAFFDAPLKALPTDFLFNYSLGSVQNAFSNFRRQYQDYQNYLEVDVIGKKIKSAQQQKIDYSNYLEKLKQQAINQEKTVALTHKQFVRDSSLFDKEVIAATDYEKSEQNYLQVKSNYQSLLAAVLNTQMQINQLNYQVIDLESQQMEKVQTTINTLKESFDNLGAEISSWEKQYILKSPIDGEISFNQFWSKNQYVTAGDKVFTIVPSLPQRILGRIKLPVSGSGKVNKGQRVLIRLDNFPCTEFGMLEGKTESISLIPETTSHGTFYTVEVSLPYGLITNYRKQLPFGQEMTGSSEIITKKLSLFERLFNPLKSITKNSI